MVDSDASRLKLNSRLIPLLIAVLLLMQLGFPYRGWVILLVSLSGLWLISYLWARTLARHLTLHREMRFGWAHVGDRLEERFTLSNSGLVTALWVEIIDHTNMPDYSTSRVTGVNARSQNRWITQGICTRRGIFTLGPTTVRTGDPFGLYTVTLSLPFSATLTVTPPVVPLPAIEIAPGGRVGEGRSRPHPFERTVSSTGVRQYVPGDSLNAVHWPTSARQGQLYVRQFDSTPAGDWWIFLDMDQQVQLGQSSAATEEHAIILAASLADRGIRAGKGVGLVAYGQQFVWRPPDHSDSQRHQIMRDLAQIQPGSTPLTDLLSKTQPIAGRASCLIVITANATGNWVEALLPLRRRGVIPTVLILDPISFGGQQSTTPLQRQLAQLGIAHTLITRDLLDRPEARPGHQGRWEWHISLSGRAIPVKQPQDMSWKMLK